jgi:hypothetical protein
MSIEELEKEYYYYWANIRMYKLYAYETQKKLETLGVKIKPPKYTKIDVQKRSKIYYETNRDLLIQKSKEYRQKYKENNVKQCDTNDNKTDLLNVNDLAINDVIDETEDELDCMLVF